MYSVLCFLFIDAILYNLVIMYIPQKKYYKINHFKNYLLNYEGSEDISNYTKILDELDSKLKNCSNINQTILVFSIILLFCSIAIISIIIIFIYYSRESQMIKLSKIEDYINGINALKFILSFINWSMALAIIAKINKIRKKEDKIGLTNEIKSGIIKVIIILTFYLMYCIFEIIFICLNVDESSESLFLYNKNYIINELDKQKNEFEKKNINEDEKSSKTSVIPFENSKQIEIEENSEKKQLELLKEKEKDINELKDQINQKDEEIKILEKINNSQNEEINLLKSQNENQITEIKELKLESENPYKLKKNEKLLTIIFDSLDQKIHHSLICKNTQIFSLVEIELYKFFPVYKDTRNIFSLNEKVIDRNKTIEENNIKFSDHISFYKKDDFNGE